MNHLISTHGYERKDALCLLQRAPPAPPRAPNAPQQCPYCTRMCPTVAGVNRHVVEAHRAAARVKRARPADQPATPSAPQRHQCHLCSFASGTKGGLTMHLRRTHDFDRRVPKNHRPSDCEESVEHLLFHCPRFAALRIKHGIRPPGDPTQWFDAKDDKQPPKSEPSLHTRKKTAASPSFRCPPPPRPLKKRKSSDAHTACANVL